MEFNFNWNALQNGAPYVTINETSIAFNDAAVSVLKSPEKIIIGFDNDNKVIGIKAYNNEEGVFTYSPKYRMTNGWVRVGCKDFNRYLASVTGVDFRSAKRYLAEYDEKTGILLVRIMKGDVKTAL